jgi:acyl-CoA reductase-like NAD-dependent aldehyde dehydrogenase
MQMFIDGKPVDSSDGKTVEITNPSDGSVIDTVPVATEADVQHTFDVARKAQKEWAAKPVYERAEIMMKFLDLVERDKDDLAETLMKENGKPITEAEGEIANIFISFKAFSERAKHLYGSVIYGNQEPGQEAHTQIIKREPIGIVVAVIPFNFPCDLFDQKVAPALLAGNSVIVKPSTDNPLTLCKLTALLGEAGVTPGAINIVTGPGSTVGHWLTSNKDADVITLTGSTAVGIETARVAADHLAHVTLELGGNDAFIVCDDADIDLAVEEMIWGRFYNCGQVCCASKRFLVQKSVKEEFEKKAVARIKKIKVGKPEDRSTELACLISEKAAKKVEGQVNKTIEQGGKLLLGWQARRRVLRAHGHHRHPQDGRRRHRHGDLRPGRLDHRLRHDRRGHRDRELQQVRPVRLRVHRGPEARLRRDEQARVRRRHHQRRELLPCLRAALWRLQVLRIWQRGRPDDLRRGHAHQVHHPEERRDLGVLAR